MVKILVTHSTPPMLIFNPKTEKKDDLINVEDVRQKTRTQKKKNFIGQGDTIEKKNKGITTRVSKIILVCYI